MDKEQERTLRALKTGSRAKAHIVNGGGIKYMAPGAWKEADAQREAVAQCGGKQRNDGLCFQPGKVF